MKAATPPKTLAEIAARIQAHLRRFEADSREGGINWWIDGKVGGLRPYYEADAWPVGRFVRVKYVAYQSGTHLSKADALAYLAWLDAGNVGRHWEALRDTPRAVKVTRRAPPKPAAQGDDPLEDPDAMALRIQGGKGGVLGQRARIQIAEAIRERDEQHRKVAR